jgi:hypothetical protein
MIFAFPAKRQSLGADSKLRSGCFVQQSAFAVHSPTILVAVTQALGTAALDPADHT